MKRAYILSMILIIAVSCLDSRSEDCEKVSRSYELAEQQIETYIKLGTNWQTIANARKELKKIEELKRRYCN